MRKYIIFFLLIFSSLSALTQEKADEPKKTKPKSSVKKEDKKKKKKKRTSKEKVSKKKEEKVKPKYERIYPPTLGVGAGVLTYYGEISKKYKANNPITSRIAFDIQFTQPINSFLNVTFQGWRGVIEANERSLQRNLNFQSTLTGGGVMLQYNFDHLLKKDRVAEPYFGLGVHAFEFLSKTDLRDKYGNQYFYWNDGSIRNIAQNAPNAESAVRLQRDYEFESDIRKLNLDGFGNYSEFAFAVPVSAGANLKLTPRWNFKIGATYFFTFTDYLDGITASGAGDRKGDDANDNLLYSHASIHYNLTKARLDDLVSEDDDIIEIDENADEDGDGVIDFLDNCLGTPEDVKVDEFGCPLDDDKDNVSNYKDEELNSAPNAIVDNVGVTYTDERLEELYLKYLDSTGVYSPIEKVDSTVTVVASKTRRVRNIRKKTYAVKIGEYEGPIPTDDVNDILSLPDVQTIEQGEKTILVVGNYDDLPDAIKRKIQLEKEGVKSVGVVSKSNDGTIRSIDGEKSNFNQEEWKGNHGIVYRIQIGAFTKKANPAVFATLPGVLSVTSDDGYTRYYSGSFDSYNDAAKQKIEILDAGFEDAFVVALKDGDKIPLAEAGATIAKGSPGTIDTPTPSSSSKLSPEDRKQLKFTVQLGSYKQQVPTDVLEKYMELGNIEQLKGDDGITKYVAGSFSNYEEAKRYKEELKQKGFDGAFIIGQFKGKTITAKEALEMLK